MPVDNLFGEEESILSLARKILESQEHEGGSMQNHFSDLLHAYSKLLVQHQRIIRVSDKQQARLSLLNRSMRQILDNIPVGIAIVDKKGRIYPIYSKFMHRLFGEDTLIEGRQIEDVLYWEEGREKEKLTVRKWLPLVFDASYDWGMIESLGPEMIHHPRETGDLYYRNSFQRVLRRNGQLSLMIYIMDVSERTRQKIKLKEIESVHNFELEVLSYFANGENAAELLDFMSETEKMVIQTIRLFRELDYIEDKMPIYHHMFRLLHSVKGISRTYGLNEFGRIAHSAEDILEKYRSREISFESGMIDGVLGSEKMGMLLGKMKEMLGNCERLINKIANQGRENAAMIRSRRRGLKIDEDSMDDLIRKVCELKNVRGVSEELAEKVELLSRRMFQLTLQPLDVVYDRFYKIVKDVSDSLGKEAELSVEGVRIYLAPEAHHQIISSLIHMLRNALDHGIEAPGIRKNKGKDPVGNIFLTTTQDEDQRVVIEFRDDGAGLDPEKIADNAVRTGMIDQEDVRKMSDQEKIELILLPGFSVRETVTDFSGRGVGMDVVAEMIKHLKGDLEIRSQKDEGTLFRISFSTLDDLNGLHDRS